MYLLISKHNPDGLSILGIKSISLRQPMTLYIQLHFLGTKKSRPTKMCSLTRCRSQLMCKISLHAPNTKRTSIHQSPQTTCTLTSLYRTSMACSQNAIILLKHVDSRKVCELCAAKMMVQFIRLQTSAQGSLTQIPTKMHHMYYITYFIKLGLIYANERMAKLIKLSTQLAGSYSC